MTTTFRYFHERSDADYEAHNKLWEENKERIIILHDNLPFKEQINNIKNDIGNNKDILAIRFPKNSVLKKNKIINEIMLGKGVVCNVEHVWYPAEVWIYSLIC
jgi:hypothetical protein